MAEGAIDEYDYQALMNAVFETAIGDEEPVIETSSLERKTDDGTIHQTRRRQRPNVALAMKLLDDRIGGPQDWC